MNFKSTTGEKSNALKSGFFILAAFSLYSCAPSDQSNTSQYSETKMSSIVGGVVADAKFQSTNGVVGLLILSENEMGMTTESVCTGTLIARRVVLTAGHCVVTPGLKGVAVLFDTNIAEAGEDRLRFAINLDVHSHYLDVLRGLAPQEGMSNRSDLALLILNEAAPADVQTAELADAKTLLQLGSKLLLAGYGNTNAVIRKIAKGKNGKLQVGLDGRPVLQEFGSVGTGTLRSVDGISVLKTLSEGKEILLDQTKLKGACHGDSGGPAFLKRADGKLVQVGVTSRGTEALGNCNQSSIYGSTVAHLPWINETAAALLAATEEAEKKASEEAAAQKSTVADL